MIRLLGVGYLALACRARYPGNCPGQKRKELDVPATPELLFDGPADSSRAVVLAHGAGAGRDTPFLNAFATGLGRRGLRVARFEFPYMAEWRRTGKKKPPDREEVLRQTWLKVVEALGPGGLVIGGKSLGGRVASLVADEAGVAGLVCLGYPSTRPASRSACGSSTFGG
jgi:predicted alpha/beta-hydrolase family hydrolase